MADKIKFIIPGKPEYLTMVRLALGSIADTAGFDLEEIEDIKTSVQEACKAICCHGKDGVAGEYTLECTLGEEALEISITDTGKQDFNKSLVTMKCMDCPNEGDIGVFIIRTLMTSVELIENPEGKKTIRIVKKKK